MEQRTDMIFQRHDLLFLTKEGREEVLSLSDDWKMSKEELEVFFGNNEISAIPGIVSRQEQRYEGKVEVGFSFPIWQGALRLRRSGLVSFSHVKKTITPYQITKEYIDEFSTKWREIINELSLLAMERQLEFGVFGSAALEAATGHSYLHSDSDIDVIFKGNLSPMDLKFFLKEYKKIQENSAISIDGEWYKENVGSIKLAELAGNASSFLVKDLHTAYLLEKAKLF